MENKYLVFSAVAAIAGLALWGWGWLARKCVRSPALPVTVTMGIGLAVVIGLGGVLNVARIAFPVAFDAVVVVGVGLAVAGVWLSRGQGWRRPTAAELATALPLVLAGWLLVASLVPPAAYNHNDDFEKYFAYPVKMLQLGTLAPDFMGSLGAESLGGQAVLQAFVAAHFPLNYLGTVDAVFCLLLCVALAGYAFAPGRWAVGAIVAELTVLAINPQMVNISSLYSGAALMMTAVCLVARPGTGEADERPAPLLLGLVYASLMALKTSFAPFVAVHGLAVVAFGPFAGRKRWSWMAQTVGWLAAGLVPWALLNAPLYLAPALPASQLFKGTGRLEPHLFSASTMGYGSTQLNYTLLALTALGLALWVAVARWRGGIGKSWPATSLAAAGLTAAGLYFVFVVWVGPVLFSDPGATRYSCPILLAIVPLGIRLLGIIEGQGARRLRPAIAAGIGALLAASFVPSAWARARQWVVYHVPLAYFPKGDEANRLEYISYAHDVLSGPVRARLVRIQSLVPAGEALGVWVSTPFLLDFRRNPITHLDPAGLATRWARMPADVHYFLFQHHGFAVRTDGDFIQMATSPGLGERMMGMRAIDFIDDLKSRSARAEVLYADQEYVLFHWSEPWPSPMPSALKTAP